MGIIITKKEKGKRENLKREIHGARRDWQKGVCAYRVPDACMSTLVGFMVGVQMVFGVVVSPDFRASIPVVTELVLGGAATKPPEALSIILARQGSVVLLVTPAAVDLSVWIGLFGWGQPMEMGVCLWGIISLVVTKRAASSDLAANTIINLMIWVIERIAPLNRGNGSFSERKMCAPAQLRELVPLRNPASKRAQRSVSLA